MEATHDDGDIGPRCWAEEDEDGVCRLMLDYGPHTEPAEVARLEVRTDLPADYQGFRLTIDAAAELRSQGVQVVRREPRLVADQQQARRLEAAAKRDERAADEEARRRRRQAAAEAERAERDARKAERAAQAAEREKAKALLMQDIRQCRDNGLSVRQTAAKLNISKEKAHRAYRKLSQNKV